MSSSRETLRPVQKGVWSFSTSTSSKSKHNNNFLRRVSFSSLLSFAAILFATSSSITLVNGSLATATATATTTKLLSSPDVSIPPEPPKLPKKKNIYEDALKYLATKARRREEQQVVHHQLLQQYRQQHLPHHAVLPQATDVNDEASYVFVDVHKKSGRNGSTFLGKDFGAFKRRSSDGLVYEASTLPNSTAEENKELLNKARELNELSSQVAEVTLDSNGSSSGSARESSGRSLGVGSSIFSRFASVLDLGRVVREIETSVMSSVSCTACKAGMGLLHHYINSGRTNEEVAAAAIKLCMNLKMQTPRVCSGIINLYVDEIVEVLKGVVIDSNDICALVIGESCGEPVSPTWKWSVAFPPIPKPPFHGFPDPKSGAKRLKVLQISDTHWDPFYEPGTNADCNEPLCCRIASGPQPPRPHLGAGLWGDYRKCDTPRNTMESMFAQISSVHSDIDYILWTGDIPAHDVWNQTHEGTRKIIKETVDLFSQYFPYTPIFPALGNHESSPVNSFAPPWVKDPKFSIDWLYKELQKDWSRWLPETTLSTIRSGAFYSTLIKPGFKLISINTNYCNNKNWWLLVNSTDPADELKWLIFELQSSELANEKVHIIGHIPPGHSDCMATWSKNYNRIVSRYESTITGQFFGHTHFDELEIFYSKEDPYRASSVAYIGPSVTPYYNLNPGYRIYYVDGDHEGSTRAVVDHETWVTDLGEANRVRASHLTWYKLYSAQEAYGLPNLNPLHWDDLIMSMYKNKGLFQKYYRFYNKNSPVAPECDDECRLRLLCDARSGRSHAREELCKPRPVHVRSSRGGLVESSRPPSKMSQLFSMISSAVSSLMGYLSYPFGFG